MSQRGWRLAALFWAALIYAASSMPGGTVGIPAPWDKLAHMSAYAVLALLLRAGGLNPGLAWLLAVVYGASDELHQRFVPGRMSDWADLAAAALGALAAFVNKR